MRPFFRGAVFLVLAIWAGTLVGDGRHVQGASPNDGGKIAVIVVGMTSSLAWILLSADTFTKVYGLRAEDALVPFTQPGIVTIPLGFLTLVVVSLMTRKQLPEA